MPHGTFCVTCKSSEEAKIRSFCNKNRLAVSKFFVQSAYEKMERDSR